VLKRSKPVEEEFENVVEYVGRCQEAADE